MSLLSRIRSYSEQRAQAWTAARTYRMIRTLPEEIQKDIGWPDKAGAKRLRRRRANSQ